jgi:hypothetical protein
MTSTGVFISRLVSDAAAHNTLNTPTVPIIFQRAPGVASGNDRGINSMEFRVLSGGSVIQTGRTPADGRIVVRAPGGRATLEILHDGNTVATYDVRIRSEPLEADNTIAGVQRRLRMLGHQLGHDGSDADGITSDITQATDRAILDFQIDEKLAFDGHASGTTTANLNTAVNSIP